MLFLSYNLFITLYSRSHLRLEMNENLLIFSSKRINVDYHEQHTLFPKIKVKKQQKTMMRSTSSTALHTTFDVLSTYLNSSKDLVIEMRIINVDGSICQLCLLLYKSKPFGHRS